MATITTNQAPSSARVRLNEPMNFVATGCALTSALVGLFILCDVLAYVWPTSALAHGWIRLFATEPDNVARTFVEGVLGSAVAAWIAALLFVPVYNRFAGH